MKIAQVAPLTESIPPRAYGGTERIVSYLTEELVRLGHDVTLFASGDSMTKARLEAVCPQAVGRLNATLNRNLFATYMMEKAFGADARKFDVIHSHLDFLGFPLIRRCQAPAITTIHGRLDMPELINVFREFSDVPLVSVSQSQQRQMPWANWKATIHHGVPKDVYAYNPNAGRYLGYIGRIAPEKAPDVAIAVAKSVRIPLRIAAKVDPVDQEYFQHAIRPLLADPLVQFVGEIDDHEKSEFLGGAIALLCPFQVEAFGLVLIEALACGTPVVTYRHGSYPEIIDDGVTGFLCQNFQELIASIGLVPQIKRSKCREAFEARFTTERMALDYVRLYGRMLSDHS
jgi:glycosyltransferase involved in cell wall biosynthesis